MNIWFGISKTRHITRIKYTRFYIWGTFSSLKKKVKKKKNVHSSKVVLFCSTFVMFQKDHENDDSDALMSRSVSANVWLYSLILCYNYHYLLLSNANQVEWHNKVVEPLFVLTKLIQKSNWANDWLTGLMKTIHRMSNLNIHISIQQNEEKSLDRNIHQYLSTSLTHSLSWFWT